MYAGESSYKTEKLPPLEGASVLDWRVEMGYFYVHMTRIGIT